MDLTLMLCGHILPSLIYLLLTVLLGVQTSQLDNANGDWPPVHYDITAAKVWKCYSNRPQILHSLHARGYSLQLEVLHVNGNWIELITTQQSLHHLGLSNCTVLAQLRDLLAEELQGSWHTLQHHSSHTPASLYQQEGNNIDSLIGVTDELKSPKMRYDSREKDVRLLSSSDHLRLKRDSDDDTIQMKDDLASDEWFNHYVNYTDMVKWYQRLVEDHPDTVSLTPSIGQSYYERHIFALHFTDRDVRTHKPKIYLQCLLHAREWISGSVCMYIAKYLATPRPSDHMLKNLLQRVEFVMVPISNPDGYFLTWLQYPKYRMWRKNVQPLEGTACAGVDLNRNFDTHWNEAADSISTDPCSELYSGTKAASELEVQILTKYFKSLGNVIGVIDFHSYHQKVLHPPAIKRDPPSNLNVMKYVSDWVASAASQVGVSYSSHSMVSIYSASGTFADWLLDYSEDSPRQDNKCMIPLTIELRPDYNNITATQYTGFLLPVTEILPTCQEMIPAFIKFTQLVLQYCL